MTGLPWDSVRAVAAGAADAVLVAPYIKVDALQQVLSLLHPDASLVCVSRWRAADLVAGVSDAHCRTLISERGGEFRLHVSLHAKYYRFGDARLVGSANLTGAGLGLISEPNLEVLCEPGSEFDGQAFEHLVLRQSRLVSDAEFAQWVALSLLVEPGRYDYVKLPAALMDDEFYNWRPKAREPGHIWRAYQGERALVPSDAEWHYSQLDLQALGLPSGLSQSHFDAWVATSLLSSGFTSRVLSLWDFDWDDARAMLEHEWGMGAAESARAKETAELWLAHFLPYIPQRPSHSSCIASE